jgi:hypothetical protein
VIVCAGGGCNLTSRDKKLGRCRWFFASFHELGSKLGRETKNSTLHLQLPQNQAVIARMILNVPACNCNAVDTGDLQVVVGLPTRLLRASKVARAI